MSGLAGWMAASRHAPEDRVIGAMLEALAHRAPEDAGASAARGAQLHIVLGQRPRQPCAEPDSGVTIAFDGEIDNAAELRAELGGAGEAALEDADGRLLLRAYRRWDQDFLRRLRGAFALALWDAREERLLLARDRFGERPLYLCEANGSVFFASEAKALLRIPGIQARVDLGALREYLAYGYVPGPRTLFGGIRKLAAASYACWQHGRRREQRYWTPSELEAAPRGAAPEAAADFATLLEDAVRAQAGAGGPCGVFLSGGLNSAAIAALAAGHQAPLRTFTVGFADASPRGLQQAARLARELGTEHHELVIPARALQEHLAEAVRFRDAPLAAAGDVALHLLARQAAPRVRRVLTGEGADTLLAGEPRHLREHLGWPFARGDWRERCLRAAGGIDRAQCDRIAAPVLNGAPVLEHEPSFGATPGASRLRRMLRFEQMRLLPDHLVERSERMTIAASVKARAPFLDHRLADLVSRLPDRKRVGRLGRGRLLRRACRERLPGGLGKGAARLHAEADAGLEGTLRSMLVDHLRGASSRTRVYYNAPILDGMLAEYLRGRRQHQQLLWMLLNLEIWHRVYRPG